MYASGVGALILVRPGDSTNALVFSGIAGFGFGAPLALVVASVQLAVHHSVLATATALIASARAISIAVFTAIYTVAFNASLKSSRADWMPKAAAQASVPAPSIPNFISEITTGTPNVALIPGLTTSMIQAGVLASQYGTSDALRVVFAIAMPFGVISAVLAYFLGSNKEHHELRGRGTPRRASC